MSTDAGAIAFTDLVGFTEFTAERGDDHALVLLDLQERIVRDTLPAEARVVKELGDGLMLCFPEAHLALDVCLALRDRFERAATDDIPLWVRMGLHWGTPRRRGDDLVGNAVNVAARIVDVAAPGELLVSEDVCHAASPHPGVCFDELGPVVMKGIPDPVRLFRADLVA